MPSSSVRLLTAARLTHTAGAIVGIACGAAGLLLLVYLARRMLCTSREPDFDTAEDNPFHHPIQTWPQAKQAESDFFELPASRAPAFPSSTIAQFQRPVYRSFPAYTAHQQAPPVVELAHRPMSGETNLGSSYHSVPGLTPPHTPRHDFAPLALGYAPPTMRGDWQR